VTRLGSGETKEGQLNGIRHFLREYTATAVKEHLRSQLEETGGSPELTRKEVELVRFVLERPTGWGTVGTEGSDHA
jgi:hypothetical protein